MNVCLLIFIVGFVVVVMIFGPDRRIHIVATEEQGFVLRAADVESLFAGITNSRHVGGGRFVVPCDTTARMYFSFGGRNITLLPQDYLIGPDTLQPYLCFAWPAASPPTPASAATSDIAVRE